MKEPEVEKMFRLLENDVEVQSCARAHSRIASVSALKIFDLLTNKVTPTTIENDVCSLEDSKVIVLCGAYLNDVGNIIHRVGHHIHGGVVANPILRARARVTLTVTLTSLTPNA